MTLHTLSPFFFPNAFRDIMPWSRYHLSFSGVETLGLIACGILERQRRLDRVNQSTFPGTVRAAMNHRHGHRQSAARLRPGAELLERRLVLTTFNVNTMLDTVAVNLQTGKDAAGRISLRSAIMAAD